MYATKKSWIRSLATYVTAIVMVLVVLLPILWTVLMSFKEPRAIFEWPPTIFFRPTLENYQAVFTPSSHYLPFVRVFTNSVIVTLTSVLIAVCLASTSAYAISRLRPRGSRILNVVILGIRMVPPIALVVPLYIIWQATGLYDTRIGLIIPFTALNIPLATWLMEGFFLDVPRNLEDAAVIDGCSPFQAFLRVVLPITAPGIAATSIFSFVLAWNNLTLPLPLTLRNAPTLPILASQARTDEAILWGQLGAVSVIMMVPVLLFAVFATRYLVKGIGSGAVKG